MDLDGRIRGLALLIVAAAVAVYFWEDSRHSTHPPGVLAPAEPVQSPLTGRPDWRQGKYTFTPRARFSMTARVLGAERYWFDGGAAVSPLDLAVGWGSLSDQRIIDQLGFSQSQRWWRYWPKGRTWPVPAAEISRQGANMHMVPAGKEILKILRSVRRGDLISVDGYLVDVASDGGWRWRTSLSRTDTGGGACEIFWAERLVIR
jgi:hypothetical protein